MSGAAKLVNRKVQKEEDATVDNKSESTVGKDVPSKGAETTKDNNSSSNIFTSFVESVGQSLKGAAAESIRPSSPLKTLDLDGIVDYIKTRKPKNVMILAGAGISTSAGLPDFRTPGTGLYHLLDEYNLESPQDIFDLDYFKKTPEAFYKLAKELFPKDITPTPTHYFIRLLEKKGMLLRFFTQNIDSLEYKAGISKEKVMAAHGSHSTNTCLKCKAKYDLAWITNILEDKDKLVAYCEVSGCDGVVKPDISFFGESLPRDFFVKIVQDFPCCDLLIVMGTSLVVQPFASLVDEVDSDTPRLLLNKDAVGPWAHLDSTQRRPILPLEVCYGVGIKQSHRDVFHGGDCDAAVRLLAEKLGWEEELDHLIEQGPPTSKLL